MEPLAVVALLLAGLVLAVRGLLLMEPGPIAELSALTGLLAAVVAVVLALT